MTEIKMVITFEGDIQRMLDILGFLLVEGQYQDYITDFKSSSIDKK